MEQPEQKIKLTMPETTVEAAEKQDDAFTGASIFDAKNVSIYYGSFRAVTDVSLTIHENEITALIGPSGCGKSTRPAVLQPDERPDRRRPDRGRDPLRRRVAVRALRHRP